MCLEVTAVHYSSLFLPNPSLLSLLSSSATCASWGWVSHISWLCFRNHRARAFLWSQLLNSCSVLLHLRQGICWCVSEDLQTPAAVPKQPCSPVFYSVPFCMMYFLGLVFSLWLFISMSRVSDGVRDIYTGTVTGTSVLTFYWNMVPVGKASWRHFGDSGSW